MSGAAYRKLHKIRYRFKKYLTAEIAEYAEIIYFFSRRSLRSPRWTLMFLFWLDWTPAARGGACMNLEDRKILGSLAASSENPSSGTLWGSGYEPEARAGRNLTPGIYTFLNLWPLRYFLSEFRLPHVIFVNRALSEVSQTILNRLRDFKTGQVKAVAVGLGVVQNRAHLFTSVLNRCPCREAGHVQSHSPFLIHRFRRLRGLL